jgi:hypothetical protein
MKELEKGDLIVIDGGGIFLWWSNLSSFQKGMVIGGGIFGTGLVAGFTYEMLNC